jgi:uncharacterized protein YjaZ
MQTTVIPTNDIYYRIIGAPSKDEKSQIYLDEFLTPWEGMLHVMGASAADPFEAAKRFGWLLPEELDTVPPQLEALEKAGAWAIMQDALERAAAAFSSAPLEAVTGWLMLASPERSDPLGRGYTGAIHFFEPAFVCQYDTPNAYNIPRLAGAAVHEMNHLVRMRAQPWNIATATVAEYIVHEGLAESFAGELFGEDILGYYVTDITEDDLNTARTLISKGLRRSGFDVIRGYVFGDRLAADWGFEQVGMPDFGGYAVGYQVVQAYMARTASTAAEATFTPAETIIEQSGYFRD